jgi:MFS family permease
MRAWPQGGLWRHRDFLKLWSAETISQFGSQISGLALPFVAIIVLHASAFEVAALGTIEFAPFILFSLPAGVWVDRLRRRPILIAGDLGRAALLASVPIAYAFDVLSIWQLYAVGFLVGTLTVFFDVAYQSYLPSLVDRAALVEGNSKLEISRSAAQLGGPGFAGALVGWITAPYAVLIDSLSFFGSALFLFRIRKPEAPVERDVDESGRSASMKSEIGAGLRYVFGNRYLRHIAASTASFNFCNSIWGAIFVVWAVRELDLSPGLVGLVFSLGNVGFLAGALLANRVAAAVGVGRAIIFAAFIGGPAGLLIPLAPHDNPAPYLVFAEVVIGFGVVVYNVNQVSFRQAICPERMQGRMNSVMRFIVWGTIPLGTLLGGALGSQVGLQETIWIGVIGGLVSFLPVALSPLWGVAEMPTSSESEAVGDPLLADARAVTAEPPGV